MGCLESKESVSQVPSNINNVERDPRIPLSSRDIFKLKQSWKGIKRNMETTGVEMFIRLFQTEEEIGYLFANFQNTHSDTLRQDEALESHALLVMATLDGAICTIDDYDAVCESLHNTGAKHYKLNNYKPKFFRLMEKPFLSAIQTTLGDRYSEAMEIIYKKTIDFIITHLQTGLLNAIEEGEKNKNPEKDASSSPSKIKDASSSPSKIKDASSSPSKIKDASSSPSKIKDASSSPSKIKDASSSPSKIRKENDVNPDSNISCSQTEKRRENSATTDSNVPPLPLVS
ncbi:neuroglobin-like [Argonauta hians]